MFQKNKKKTDKQPLNLTITATCAYYCCFYHVFYLKLGMFFRYKQLF